ncbi:MAG: sigma-70 family RNA polymerase sigma factor [Bacteroidota bacterium]
MNEGDFKRFLVEAHQYCLPRLVRLNAPRHDAEDAFMEAIYQFWRDIQDGKVSHEGNLKALVFVMSRNRWLGRLRKSRRGNLKEYNTDPVDLLNMDLEAYAGQDAAQFDLLIKQEEEDAAASKKASEEARFKHAFEQLNEKCRELLLRFIVEKKRLKDLQQSLGYVSVDAIKMAKMRCKKSLVKYYKTLLQQEEKV